MTEEKIKQWEKDHCQIYTDLSESCGSVPELMLKIEVYGQKWTKWDWVLFFKYLVYIAGFSNRYRSYAGYSSLPDEPVREKSLLDDMFHELDEGDALDKVFTDKTVVMNFVSLAENGGSSGDDSSDGTSAFTLCARSFLAHVFRKFPSMWKMNWMFMKKRSGPRRGERVHRLTGAVPFASRRPEGYFQSKAFLDDFVHMHFNKWQKLR